MFRAERIVGKGFNVFVSSSTSRPYPVFSVRKNKNKKKLLDFVAGEDVRVKRFLWVGSCSIS